MSEITMATAGRGVRTCGICAMLACGGVALLSAGDPLGLRREQMVKEQIEGRGIRHSALLEAIRATPRHLFVPPDIRPLAYEDHPLPIGYGATISQPYIVALMTELLTPSKKHRVLEIGTGSGYQAAILARLAAEVYTVEIVPELARSAAQTLTELGHSNVTVRQGDGYLGWPEQAPFDGIMLTAAPPEIPEALLAQLAKGGRLVAPVGSAAVQELVVIEKNAAGKLKRHTVASVSFLKMKPAGK